MIILTPEAANSQIKELINYYPDLKITTSFSDEIRLRGKLHIFRTALNYTLNRSFEVELRIPINSEELPVIMDLEGAIDDSYPHRYLSGALCLETDTAIRLRFIDGFQLIPWIEEFVEPYFFSYAYYSRFGSFPFSERPHGVIGIINTYQDLFDEKDLKTTAALLRFCGERTYRGHIGCPCGSGKKLRDCHGTVLFPIMTDSRKQEIVINDLERIRSVLSQYESTGKNNETSK